MKNYTLRFNNGRIKHFFLFAISALLVFTGCKKDDDGGPVKYTNIQFVNAILGSNGVDVYLDNNRETEGVAFAESTGYYEVTAGGHKISATPAGSRDALIDLNQNFDGDSKYSVYGIGSKDALVVVDTAVAAPANQALVRYINLSPNEADASYIIKQDNTTTPFDFAARPYKQNSTYKIYTPGTYSFTAIDFDANGTNSSANSGAINLTGGKIYTLFLVGKGSASNLTLKYIEE